MNFQATILLNGKTATGIRDPGEVADRLGGGKRAPVTVTINGYTYRSSIAVMGGAFMLPVSAEVRAAAGVSADDKVDVELSLDTQPRELDVPLDLRAAFDAAAEAAAYFDSLSYSNRRRVILQIDGAKTDETRQRRIAKAVDLLRAGCVP